MDGGRKTIKKKKSIVKLVYCSSVFITTTQDEQQCNNLLFFTQLYLSAWIYAFTVFLWLTAAPVQCDVIDAASNNCLLSRLLNYVFLEFKSLTINLPRWVIPSLIFFAEVMTFGRVSDISSQIASFLWDEHTLAVPKVSSRQPISQVQQQKPLVLCSTAFQTTRVKTVRRQVLLCGILYKSDELRLGWFTAAVFKIERDATFCSPDGNFVTSLVNIPLNVKIFSSSNSSVRWMFWYVFEFNNEPSAFTVRHS